jgi:hypothetical protein
MTGKQIKCYQNILVNFVLFIISRWDNYEELCIRPNEAPPQFALPSVRGSITIFQSDGLGFEHQQNALHIVRVTLLCGDRQRQNLLIKTKDT